MRLPLDIDDAHPAGPKAGQLWLVAQRRDLDPVVAADLQDGLALEAFDQPSVDLDPDPRRRLRPLWSLSLQEALDERAALGHGQVAFGADHDVGHRSRSPQLARAAAVAPASRIGWQTPAGQVPWRRCS